MKSAWLVRANPQDVPLFALGDDKGEALRDALDSLTFRDRVAHWFARDELQIMVEKDR